MYLVSNSSHVPLVVFSEKSEAYRYLRKINNIDRDYVYLDRISDEFDEVYFECRDFPRKTLGFVRRGVLIDPGVNKEPLPCPQLVSILDS